MKQGDLYESAMNYLLIVEVAKEFLEDLVVEKILRRHHESDSGFAFK